MLGTSGLVQFVRKNETMDDGEMLKSKRTLVAKRAVNVGSKRPDGADKTRFMAL